MLLAPTSEVCQSGNWSEPLDLSPDLWDYKRVKEHTPMKFTKAQKEILLTLENGGEVFNWSQRMRALQPLLDMGIVCIKVTNDKNGITEDVRIALVD